MTLPYWATTSTWPTRTRTLCTPFRKNTMPISALQVCWAAAWWAQMCIRDRHLPGRGPAGIHLPHSGSGYRGRGALSRGPQGAVHFAALSGIAGHHCHSGHEMCIRDSVLSIGRPHKEWTLFLCNAKVCGSAGKLPRNSGSFVKDFPQKGRKCPQGIMRRFYLC